MCKNARFLSKNCEKLSLFVPLFNTPRANCSKWIIRISYLVDRMSLEEAEGSGNFEF